MLVCGVDIETTGIEQAQGHRIVEICMQTYDLDTRACLDNFVQRVHPARSIQPRAQEIHGISIEDLVGCPGWGEVAPVVLKKLENCALMIAHNIAFDGPFIAMELLRLKYDIPDIESYCTMTNARWATPTGKSPSLGELCFSLGVAYNPACAHSAQYDVERTMSCWFAGLDRGFFNLPAKLEQTIDSPPADV
jgi:DNA polymerase-3 subunit epsilon